MTDLESRLRDTLHRRAGTVPRHTQVPSGLGHRASRRIARNGVAAVLAVAIAIGGTLTAVQALGGSSTRTPAVIPPTCQAAQLRGSARLTADAKLARAGSLVLANRSGGVCSLQGGPVVRVLGIDGSALPIRAGTVDPQWLSQGATPPEGWPVVTLDPGDRAGIRITWNSWCSETLQPTTWEIQLPGESGVIRFGVNAGQDIPGCTDAKSRLKVGPLEPFSP
jgi:hypothetical protein